jgi:transcriptional regulator with XRE-family HTH domain
VSGFVYFAQVDRMLKVGFTRDVASRVAQIRTNCVGEVVMLGCRPGTTLDECYAHDALADFRSHGDWYALCDGSRRVVERLISGAEETPASPVAERLCAVIGRLGLTGDELAATAGVDPAQISRWMRGVNVPSKASVRRLAAALGVSPHEILTGRAPAEAISQGSDPPPDDSWIRTRLRHCIDASPLRGVEIARAVGVSQPTISRWRTGTSAPSGAHLSRLLEVLKVDPDAFFTPPTTLDAAVSA